MTRLATEAAAVAHKATESRREGRVLIITRTFDGPARLVFEAWTTPELLMAWWAPKSFGITLISCEVDARTGGTYRFVFGVPGSEETMAFHGRYLEVVPEKRLVWTNDEQGEAGSVTTVTLEESGGQTLLVLEDVYPSEAALDEAIASGSTGAYPEQFEALDDVLAERG